MGKIQIQSHRVSLKTSKDGKGGISAGEESASNTSVAPYQSHHPKETLISFQDNTKVFRTDANDLKLEIIAEQAEGAVQLSGDVCLDLLTFSSDCDETSQTEELWLNTKLINL